MSMGFPLPPGWGHLVLFGWSLYPGIMVLHTTQQLPCLVLLQSVLVGLVPHVLRGTGLLVSRMGQYERRLWRQRSELSHVRNLLKVQKTPFCFPPPTFHSLHTQYLLLSGRSSVLLLHCVIHQPWLLTIIIS